MSTNRNSTKPKWMERSTRYLRNVSLSLFVSLCLNLNFKVAYTQSEAVYRWNEDRQIVIASGMKMSQFDLVSTPVSNYTAKFKHGITAYYLQTKDGLMTTMKSD